ncbi:MAG: sigma-70 family RNA polymerase sigma factor [Planctomycetales bacterium]|nr:sigma-70 family RNA polymerase sigma factor [Planctomycetales bacterium]
MSFHLGDSGEPSSDELEQLLAQARGGSSQALGHLLARYRDRLLAVASRELHPQIQAKSGASDIVQETFLRAQHAFNEFRGQSDVELAGWLRSILLNHISNVRRQYMTGKREIGREKSLQAGQPGDSVRLPLAALDSSPSVRCSRNEEAEWLAAAIGRLPDDYRQVIEMRYWQQLTFVEIGERMQRSAEATRKLWARALVRLDQELTKADPSHELG